MSEKNICGIILNGGQSSRMGTDKGNLLLPNHLSMLAHIEQMLRKVFGHVCIIGGSARPESIESRTDYFPDDEPGQGPIGGLRTLARLNISDYYVITTCDQPLVAPELFGMLSSVSNTHTRMFRSSASDGFIPFPGLYAQNDLATLLHDDARAVKSMRQFVAALDVEWIDVPDFAHGMLTGANTPDEFRIINENFS